jgi:CBS-domain-containing membrane protein
MSEAENSLRQPGLGARALALLTGAQAHNARSVRDAILAGLGGFLAIGLLVACTLAAATPLIIAPFGASAVLLFSIPASPLARPRNVVGGHVLSALVGLVVLHLVGASLLAMAIGVGCAIAVMRLTGTTHPPAGANPIVIIAAAAPWWFVAVPVACGAAILVACARLYHRLVTGQAYPG